LKKILFIANQVKDRAPGQRFRFEQYFDYLQQNGYECTLSPLLSQKDLGVFYQSGRLFTKAWIIAKSYLKRWQDKTKASDYDIIFIFREAFMTGSISFEQSFSKSGAKLVFDFDDAIWHLDMSDANKRFSFMKRASKTGDIISLCDMVFAGNPYLAEYSSQFNDNVKIVPTTIDMNEYKRIKKENDDGRVCIGWSGSITTIKHFNYAVEFL